MSIPRRSVAALFAIAATAVVASAAAAGTANNITISRTNGKLAFAQWQLNDAYNTGIAIGGNDLVFLDTGSPPFFANGVLVDIFQHYCDTATDEDVFVDLSGFPSVGANVVKVNDALNSGSVVGTVPVSGIIQRAPNCASPDYSQRTVSFPTLLIQINLQWTASRGNNTTPSHFELKQVDQSGRFLFQQEGINGFVNASVAGSITSPDLGISGALPAPYVSFLDRSQQLQVQVSVPH